MFAIFFPLSSIHFSPLFLSSAQMSHDGLAHWLMPEGGFSVACTTVYVGGEVMCTMHEDLVNSKHDIPRQYIHHPLASFMRKRWVPLQLYLRHFKHTYCGTHSYDVNGIRTGVCPGEVMFVFYFHSRRPHCKKRTPMHALGFCLW